MGYTFYAKQTQFSGDSNEPKPCYDKPLRTKNTPPPTVKTNPIQTQSNPISKAKKKKTLPLRMKKRIKNVEFTQYKNIE
ncbi:MAG: hypothetical protein ACYS1A_03855 [Planctomycetota bacterium]